MYDPLTVVQVLADVEHGAVLGFSSVDTVLTGLPSPVVEAVGSTATDVTTVVAGVGIVLVALLGALLVGRNWIVDRRAATDSEPDAGEEVLTDREQVRQLVERNGGRMKQTDIVDSVEWSKAKVSRLLADLESDGEITKLRLGRENLICLPGSEPPASRSVDSQRGERT